MKKAKLCDSKKMKDSSKEPSSNTHPKHLLTKNAIHDISPLPLPCLSLSLHYTTKNIKINRQTNRLIKRHTATLCSTLLLYCITLITLPSCSQVNGQNINPINNQYSIREIPKNIFDTQGGIEISLPAQLYTPALTAHPGITLDHGCSQHMAQLYITQEGYTHLLTTDLPFQYIPREPTQIVMKGPKQMASDLSYMATRITTNSEEIPLKNKNVCLPDIDYYPTYEAYVDLMYTFADAYPALCQIMSIGTLDSGRELLVAHIGNNFSTSEKEPHVLLTASMHGDETAGYTVSLQLIDYLLCQYNTDDRIKHLIDNTHIFINPLANPDGMYQEDNTTIIGAERRNSKNIDLNRNFPDAEDGPNPDNRPTQLETKAFMDLADQYNIDLAVNMHGGAELANYPWDTFEREAADNSWWIETCRAYVDTVHQHTTDPNYFKEENNGISNGFKWYEVAGSRQDYMVYFKRAREFTLELTRRKTVDSDSLPTVWHANRRSLINYIEKALTGLRGIVTDCNSGLPINAEIRMKDHDIDNSSVFSDSLLGYYGRYLDDGIYESEVIAMGYDTLRQTINILDGETLIWDIELCPEPMSNTEEKETQSITVLTREGYIEFKGLSQDEVKRVAIYSHSGELVKATGSSLRVDIHNVPDGYYIVQIESKERFFVRSIFLR